MWHSYSFNYTSGSCGSQPWVCQILWRLLSLGLQQLEQSSPSLQSHDELFDRLHRPVCPSPLKWQVRSKHHAQGSYVKNGLTRYQNPTLHFYSQNIFSLLREIKNMAATDDYSRYWLICSLLSVLRVFLKFNFLEPKLDREIDSFLQLTVQNINSKEKRQILT